MRTKLTTFSYDGFIKIPNESPFAFSTVAASPGKAKNNGLHQYSKFKNMNIAQLKRSLNSMGDMFVLEVTPKV